MLSAATTGTPPGDVAAQPFNPNSHRPSSQNSKITIFAPRGLVGQPPLALAPFFPIQPQAPHGFDVAKMRQQRARHPFRRFVAIALNSAIPAFALADDLPPLCPMSCGSEFPFWATAPMAPNGSYEIAQSGTVPGQALCPLMCSHLDVVGAAGQDRFASNSGLIVNGEATCSTASIGRSREFARVHPRQVTMRWWDVPTRLDRFASPSSGHSRAPAPHAHGVQPRSTRRPPPQFFDRQLHRFRPVAFLPIHPPFD